MRDIRWYQQDDETGAQTLVHLARKLREDQERRHQDRLLYAALYGWREVLHGFAGSHSDMLISSHQTQRLSLNIVRTMVDACVARVAALASPKPTFRTIGANYEHRTRAEQMDQAIDGVFHTEKFRAKSLRQFRSALVFGEGWLWHEADAEAGKPRIVRTLPGEVFVDEGEALTGEPRRIYRRRYYDRFVLAEAFPSARGHILAARGVEADSLEWGYNPNHDQVLVTEGWSLPTRPGAGDGRYLAAIDGTWLQADTYTRPRFPGSRYAWDEPEVGCYGQGLAEELCGIQLEINDLLEQINDAHQSVAGKWLIEQNSGVNKAGITDERDGILVYRNTAPVYITPNAVPPQMYEYLWQLVSRAYEITGISQLAATSMKPAGLNSGAAIRAYEDNQSARFKHKLQAFEDAVCESARLTVDSIQDLALMGDVRIRALTNGEMKDIEWKAVALDDDAYLLQVNATSSLPATTAGQLALVDDLSRVEGLMRPEDLLELMTTVPDVQAFARRRNATRRLTEKMLSDIVASKGEKFAPPEPEMNLAEALNIARDAYLDYRDAQADPNALDAIQRWLRLAKQLMDQAAPPPPPAAPGPPPPPEGAMP